LYQLRNGKAGAKLAFNLGCTWFANVRALAKALNVSSDYLLGRTENMAGATTAFRGEEDLTDADREHIQLMINLMRERREQSDQ